MKFKKVFCLFNAIVVCAVIFFYISVILLFPDNISIMYWDNMIMPIILFLGLVVTLDLYLIQNWQLFTLLENEDWVSLLKHLENILIKKGNLRKYYVNLYVKTAMALSNYNSINELGKIIRPRKPELFYKTGVALGIPIMLDGSREAVIDFFSPLADNLHTYRRDWAKWCRSYALGNEGKEELLTLIDVKDPAIRLLSLDILMNMSDELSESGKDRVEEVKNQLKREMYGNKGTRKLEQSLDNHFMAVVLGPKINKARENILAENDYS